jgi:hypothetical protein
MPQHGRRNVDQLLLMALACGATYEAAAAKAGVSKTTVYRRLQAPEFQRQLQETQAEMVRRTSGTLTAAGTEAIKTLLSLLQPSAPAAVRLGAARSVLELGIKIRELAELEKRVAALEERSDLNNAA